MMALQRGCFCNFFQQRGHHPPASPLKPSPVFESESTYVLFSAVACVIKHWWKLVSVAPCTPDLDKALNCWLPSFSRSIGNLNRVLSESATHRLTECWYRQNLPRRRKCLVVCIKHKKLGAADILSNGGHTSDLGSNLVCDVPLFNSPLYLSQIRMSSCSRLFPLKLVKASK